MVHFGRKAAEHKEELLLLVLVNQVLDLPIGL